MIFITRREHFNAAHRLFNKDWSEEENLRVFGKCSNPNWHGHNYELFVTVKGNADLSTGFVMNLTLLSLIIKEAILDQADHKNLNIEVPFMKDILPTTENLSVAIWNTLKPRVEKHGAKLHCVKIKETENNFVEYFGG
ncbi:MAG: 6-carboxytetrahydropterin synthase [Bacteroidota bacterium]